MRRTLSDYKRRSQRAASREVQEARAIFDQAYSLARQVVELRQSRQLTQVELAQRSGLPQSQISRIESGAVSPTTATLARVAEALGADLRLVARESA